MRTHYLPELDSAYFKVQRIQVAGRKFYWADDLFAGVTALYALLLLNKWYWTDKLQYTTNCFSLPLGRLLPY